MFDYEEKLLGNPYLRLKSKEQIKLYEKAKLPSQELTEKLLKDHYEFCSEMEQKCKENDSVKPNKKTRFAKRIWELKPKLWVHALITAKHKEEAEDLIQDTFERAIENHTKYSEQNNLLAWLKEIMKNVWLDKEKKRQNSIEALIDKSIDITEIGSYLTE